MIVGLALFLVGVVLSVLGLWRLYRRRYHSAITLETTGVFVIALSMVFILIASNLVIYNRLVYETPVATISFKQKHAQLFDVSFAPVDALTQQYEIAGDEWQLDARILKWHGVANVIGLDANYQLHRLTGRYRDIEQERHAAHSVYRVGQQTEIDLWDLASEYHDWLSWMLDAGYGSAVFLPMTDGAKYEVSVSQSGLIARPANPQAKEAVSRWIGF